MRTESIRCERTSILLKQSFNRLLIPRFLFSILIVVEQLTVPIFLGWLIGAKALAVVSVTAPLTLFWGTMESLFLRSAPILISRARGENKYDEANRIYTALIFTALILFSIISFILYHLLPSIVELFTKDKKVLEFAVAYYRIFLIAFPFYYFCTCTERVFALDGRAVFFSIRKFVQTVLAIVFPYFFISVLHFGIEGIALASMAKFFAAYSLILSHFFCKRRTIFFDFSHFFNFKETWSILRQSIKLGSPLASHFLLIAVSQSAINLLIGNTVGVKGLAVYTAVYTFFWIIYRIDADIKSIICIMCGFLYGERDFYGVKHIFAYAIKWYLVISGILSLSMCIFANKFCTLFNITDPEAAAMYISAIYIFSLYIFLRPVFDIINSYLVTVKKEWYSLYLSAILPLSITSIAYCLANVIGYNAVWIGYSAGILFSLGSLFCIMLRKTSFFPKVEESKKILSYSFPITTQHAADVLYVLDHQFYHEKSCTNANGYIQLILEEILTIIDNANQKNRSKLTADLRLESANDTLHISLSCSGLPLNELTIHNSEVSKTKETGQKKFNTIIKEFGYDRVMYLNYIRFQHDTKETLIEMCFLLNLENICYISELIEKKVRSLHYSRRIAALLSLLIEEGSLLLFNIEKTGSKSVHASVTICKDNDLYFITLSDDGMKHDTNEFVFSGLGSEHESLNKTLLGKFSQECIYERVMNHNYFTITMRSSN